MTVIERNAAHEYTQDGFLTKHPSVTTVLDAAFGKGNLPPWYARQAIEFVLSKLDSMRDLHGDLPLSAASLSVANQLEAEFTKRTLAEADHGDEVHAALEVYVKERIANEARPFGEPWRWTDQLAPNPPEIEHFLRWEAKRKPEWVASEVMFVQPHVKVGNRFIGFGGTADAIARIDNELVLVDFKTGWTHVEHLLQLAGYALGLADRHRFERFLLLQLRPDGYKEKWLDVTPADQQAFLRCVANFAWLQERKEMFA